MHQALTCDVVAGDVYELRVRLHRRQAAETLSVSQVEVEFRDTRGCVVTESLFCQPASMSFAGSIDIETLSGPAEGDALVAAATASRFLIAPPDASLLTVRVPDAVVLEHLEVNPLAVLWHVDGDEMVKQMTHFGERRWTLLCGVLGLAPDHHVAQLVRDVPREQAEDLRARFAPSGDWNPILDLLDNLDEEDDHRERMTRLRARLADPLRVGLIGSPHLRERVEGHAEVVWLRETEAEEQIALLALDLVLIETARESGPGDWAEAFHSLSGALPERGAALFQAAEAAHVPVRLHVSVSPRAARMWAGAVARAAAISAEGEADWSGLPREPAVVPRSVEPTACTPFTIRPKAPNRLLVPVGSDLFQFPEFAAFLGREDRQATLIAEFRYQFVVYALQDRLERLRATAAHLTRSQQRLLLRHASLVLLSNPSLRAVGELEGLALDAIASGAIPILFGPAPEGSSVLQALDQVLVPLDLQRLQTLYAAFWVRERRWKSLYRWVVRNHIWRSEHLRAVLGQHPTTDPVDAPLASAVVVSKRPWLLPEVLATFRRQGWSRRELIVVLNSDDADVALPELRDEERVFAVPTAATIGECLNLAIQAASGAFWAKMDDDDIYSTNYLEDLAAFYRASQADVCGRKTPIFYFEGVKQTAWNASRVDGTFRNFKDSRNYAYVSGATLSALRGGEAPRFSTSLRNSADSNWVEEVQRRRVRYVSADGTSMIVFRSDEPGFHTWRMQSHMIDHFMLFSEGSAAGRLEEPA